MANDNYYTGIFKLKTGKFLKYRHIKKGSEQRFLTWIAAKFGAVEYGNMYDGRTKQYVFRVFPPN